MSRSNVRKLKVGANGFTLIELLVVIAIIAVLIAALLPALGKARKSARQTISLANIRSIAQAGAVYQQDSKGSLPLECSYGVWGSDAADPDAHMGGWCTWSAWGRTPSAYWIGAYGSVFDIKMEDRPLNQYLYPNLLLAPRARRGVGAQSTSSERTQAAMPVFKDPSDALGHQQNWPSPNPASNNGGQTLSCYDDVGTSYQWQAKWYDQISLDPAYSGLSMRRKFDVGARRFRIADSFAPSRMLWLNDEWCDITIYQPAGDAVRNGYDDINKAVVGFMDAHAAYLPIITGGSAPADGLWDRVPAFNNEKYTVIFPFVR